VPEQQFFGAPASPGLAVGVAWRPAAEFETAAPVGPERREAERDVALAALQRTVEVLYELAATLPAEEAEIVETGAMMGQDPVLVSAVEKAVLAQGLSAAQAIVRVANRHADAIAAIGDELLAARADDVRSLGRRAAAVARGKTTDVSAVSNAVLVADDLGPADVAEFASVLSGIVLAGGGPTAHAAIVARSLGIPMVTGAGEPLEAVRDGALLVLDGSSGAVVVDPSADRARRAAEGMHVRRLASARASELRDEPATTTDGWRITVLANVASAAELDVALGAGAEGIGLLRTELAFLDAERWPTRQEHAEVLDSILGRLGNRPAVVRVLDFGADKSPPFLHGVPQRGLELLLAHADALADQLRAILAAAQRHEVRILLPMVDTAAQLARTRELLEDVAAELGIDAISPMGAMIETPTGARNADEIASRSGFLSIGTNDLTSATLGADRFSANDTQAHHPLVLRAIARSVAAAHDAGIRIEVCGEAASNPLMLPLLVGLGVDELSVGAARVGHVRAWVRQLEMKHVAGLARSVLTMDSAEEVEWTVRPLASELEARVAGPAPIAPVGS